MIVANVRAQSVPGAIARAAMLLAAACGTSERPPSPCPDLTRDVAAIPMGNPRVLLRRVDEIMAAEAGRCADVVAAMRETGIGGQLALARRDDDRPTDAVAWLSAVGHPAVALRRAELYDRLGRPADALGALAPAMFLDDEARLEARLLAVSAAARAGDRARLEAVVAATPLPDRPRVAHRAAADVSEADLAALSDPSDADLATAVADRLEELRGPAAARPARERASALAPDDADRWDAVARARMAAGATDDALAAWDTAAAIAPAQPAFRIAPIRALLAAQDSRRATARATALAATARASGDVELLVAASDAAAVAGDHALALAAAGEARGRRPGDGRLELLVAQRNAEAERFHEAAQAYVELLVCGAHGQAWHRHEVAARLDALPDPIAVRAALDAPRTCATVDPTDLESYLASLRARNP